MEAEVEWMSERFKNIRNKNDQLNNDAELKKCAIELLNKARTNLNPDDGDLELSNELTREKLIVFRLVQEARLCELNFLSDDALKHRASALSLEIQQRAFRSPWRTEVEKMLRDAEKPDSKFPRELLKECMKFYNEYELSMYIRKIVIRNQLHIILFCMSFIVPMLVIVIFWLLYLGYDLSHDLLRQLSVGQQNTSQGGGTSPNINFAHALIPVASALAGGIGACLSSLLSMTSVDYDPDIYTSRIATWARPWIGAVSGLIAYLFILAGIIPLLPTAVAAISVAVAVGFSERLILGTIAKADPNQQSAGSIASAGGL